MRALYPLLCAVVGLTACGDSSATPDAPIDVEEVPAMLTSMPSEIDFGSVGATTTSDFVQVTIGNIGKTNTGRINTQINDTDASLFRIINNGCNTAIVVPNGNCILQMQFRPEQPDHVMRTATLTVSASPGGETRVRLKG